MPSKRPFRVTRDVPGGINPGSFGRKVGLGASAAGWAARTASRWQHMVPASPSTTLTRLPRKKPHGSFATAVETAWSCRRAGDAPARPSCR